MVRKVEKVHGLRRVVDILRHRSRQQRHLSRVDRPRGRLPSRDAHHRLAALRGRDHVAAHIDEFGRQRVLDEIDGLVHRLLATRYTAVDDDVVDDPVRNRDHTAHDGVGLTPDLARLAWRRVPARENGDTADQLCLVIEVKVVR